MAGIFWRHVAPWILPGWGLNQAQMLACTAAAIAAASVFALGFDSIGTILLYGVMQLLVAFVLHAQHCTMAGIRIWKHEIDERQRNALVRFAWDQAPAYAMFYGFAALGLGFAAYYLDSLYLTILGILHAAAAVFMGYIRQRVRPVSATERKTIVTVLIAATLFVAAVVISAILPASESGNRMSTRGVLVGFGVLALFGKLIFSKRAGAVRSSNAYVDGCQRAAIVLPSSVLPNHMSWYVLPRVEMLRVRP